MVVVCVVKVVSDESVTPPVSTSLQPPSRSSPPEREGPSSVSISETESSEVPSHGSSSSSDPRSSGSPSSSSAISQTSPAGGTQDSSISGSDSTKSPHRTPFAISGPSPNFKSIDKAEAQVPARTHPRVFIAGLNPQPRLSGIGQTGVLNPLGKQVKLFCVLYIQTTHVQYSQHIHK